MRSSTPSSPASERNEAASGPSPTTVSRALVRCCASARSRSANPFCMLRRPTKSSPSRGRSIRREPGDVDRHRRHGDGPECDERARLLEQPSRDERVRRRTGRDAREHRTRATRRSSRGAHRIRGSSRRVARCLTSRAATPRRPRETTSVRVPRRASTAYVRGGARSPPRRACRRVPPVRATTSRRPPPCCRCTRSSRTVAAHTGIFARRRRRSCRAPGSRAPMGRGLVPLPPRDRAAPWRGVVGTSRRRRRRSAESCA